MLALAAAAGGGGLLAHSMRGGAPQLANGTWLDAPSAAGALSLYLLTQLQRAAVIPGLPGGDYTMDHSAVLVLLERSGRTVAIFTPPFKEAALAQELRRASAYLGR